MAKLPSPNFQKNRGDQILPKAHFLTPSGMSLLPNDRNRLASVTSNPQSGAQGRHDQNKDPNPLPVMKQYCKPCEMQFDSIDSFRSHRSEHEKCPIDTCQFRGHAEIMEKHLQAQHMSSLLEKFKKLNTPEEIAAWKEERRKRYPTLANVQMRERAAEQRRKRGEKLGPNKSRFGKKQDRRQIRNDKEPRTKEEKSTTENTSKWKKKEKRRNKGSKTSEKSVSFLKAITAENEKQSLDDEVKCCGILKFKGTSTLDGYKHAKEKKTGQNVLSNLLGMYGSDDECSDTDDEENAKEEPLDTDRQCTKENHSAVSCETIPEDSNKINSAAPTDDYGPTSSIIGNKANNNQMALEMTRPILQVVSTFVADDPSLNSSDEGPDETSIQRESNLPVIEESSATFMHHGPPCKRSKINDLPTTTKQNRRKCQFGLNYKKRLRRQNTMLEKLLESDIRHERNVLLQCVRFVCENNFFTTKNTGQT